jgi:hypothetical protein
MICNGRLRAEHLQEFPGCRAVDCRRNTLTRVVEGDEHQRNGDCDEESYRGKIAGSRIGAVRQRRRTWRRSGTDHREALGEHRKCHRRYPEPDHRAGATEGDDTGPFGGVGGHGARQRPEGNVIEGVRDSPEQVEDRCPDDGVGPDNDTSEGKDRENTDRNGGPEEPRPETTPPACEYGRRCSPSPDR